MERTEKFNRDNNGGSACLIEKVVLGENSKDIRQLIIQLSERTRFQAKEMWGQLVEGENI